MQSFELTNHNLIKTLKDLGLLLVMPIFDIRALANNATAEQNQID
jgi:hypothetical protein